MVGLVLISHSQDLANALTDLVKRMSSKEVPIAVVADDNPDHQGIDAVSANIIHSIQSVYSTDGVIVIMDSGSTILSAEMAMKSLSEEIRPHVCFCAAPIVEGSIAAAVQISLDSDLATVCREAGQALLPKIKRLSSVDESVAAEDHAHIPPTYEEEAVKHEIILTIKNPHGLHARPAARFVQTAAAFNAAIQVCKLLLMQESPLDGERGMSSEQARRMFKGPVPATSLSRLTTLGVGQGDQISVSAIGNEANQALEALSRLVEENFGEGTEDDEETFEEKESRISGTPDEFFSQGPTVIPLSDGIAIGPAFHYQTTQVQIPDYQIDDPVHEWERLQGALNVVQRAITQRRHRMQTSLGNTQAAIFDAHLLILEDTMLLAQVREQIFQHHRNAAIAWNTGIQEIAESLRALSDTYLQQRANDVVDVGNQVLSVLMGQRTTVASLSFPEAVILVARELTPTLIAQLDVSQVLGLITRRGGSTDHSSILARALGIPAISGVKASVLNTVTGTTIAIDGFKGKLWINPSPQICQELQRRQSDWSTQREQLLEASHQPATTCDGRNIRIAANAGSVIDAKTALRNGAEAIGVLRTEFLYLTRNTPPSETEQLETLSQIGDIMGINPVYVRTLDIGGDKAIPYLKLPEEANPFLGLRSIRLSLRSPDLFRIQLCAILRASMQFDMRIMFPMISKIDELTQALCYLEEAHQILERKHIPHRWPLESGMMIETPSAAFLTSSFAKHINFFSIGTNDLTQYTLAVERGNPYLTDYADGLHPAVLQLVKHVVDAAHQHGKVVGVCGELAGDLVAVPVLVGLGVDELSLNPGNIPQVKVMIRKLDMASASTLARNVLQTESEMEARRLAKDFIAKL